MLVESPPVAGHAVIRQPVVQQRGKPNEARHSSGEQDAEPTVLKNLIEITTLFPNPASTHATLTVTVKEDLSAKVQVFTMDGALVEQVFDGQMYEGWPTTLELDVNSLESGMYQVRVSSKDFVTTKKLLVIE